MFADALFLLLLAVSTLLLQLIGLPLLLAVFGKSDSRPEWWAWGRLVGWLAIGLLIWLVAHTGIPINSAVGFWSVFGGGLLAVFLLKPLQARQRVRQFLHDHRQQILIQEALFISGFLLLGLIRTFHPQVLDLEKFMNAGLIQGYLRSPTLPAVDFWLAGRSLNYYSFGHFLASLMLRFWQLPVEIGFNVLLGWVMGLVLVEAYALGRSLLGSFLPAKPVKLWPLFIAGLTTALLIVFGGNTHPVWYFLQQRGFTGYWYPDVTRFISNSIHEIPAYSFIVSDLHAHFLSLPIALLTIFAAWRWLATIHTFENFNWSKLWRHAPLWRHSLMLGVLLGVLGMSNTWDMLIYSLFLMVLGILSLWTNYRRMLALAISGLQAGLAALIVFAPWFLHFDSIINGVFLVTERTPLWQLAVLWSGHVGLSLLAVIIVGWQLIKHLALKPAGLFLLSLGLTALICLSLPEIIYFKDIYPTFPRANTMFKFAFQAFIMMNLLIGWLAGWLMQGKIFRWKIIHGGLLLIVGLYVGLVLVYPFLGFPNYYGGFRTRDGLDGLAWLRQANPAEYEAVMWLRNQTTGRPVVLEAVGDSYSQYGRASVFSGLPTVLGWRAHEWLWRGGYEIPRERTAEVKQVYEEPRSEAALTTLTKYQIKYIFIGVQERKAYELDLSGLQALGKTVFQNGNILVIERQ
jgi:uncharacterized membrane protein